MDHSELINSNIYINDSRYNILFVDKKKNIRKEGKILGKILSMLNLAINSVVLSTEIDEKYLSDKLDSQYKLISNKLDNNLYCKSIAIGVIVSTEELLRRDKNRDPMLNRRFVVHGFGKTGVELVKNIKNRALLVAISTDFGTINNNNGLDVDRILDLYEKHGDDFVLHYKEVLPEIEIYNIPCDVFIPINNINTDKIIDVRPIIIPAGRTVYDENVLVILENNGITCFPEIVSVSGPIIAVISQLAGCYSTNRILDIIREVIQSISRDLIRAGRACGVRKSLRIVAEERAETNNSLHIEYMTEDLEIIDVVEDFIREYALAHYLL